MILSSEGKLWTRIQDGILFKGLDLGIEGPPPHYNSTSSCFYDHQQIISTF